MSLVRPLVRPLIRSLKRNLVGVRDFSPLDLGSDLLAWWDASQGVATSGSAVTGWTDRKNGLTVTQALGASRPTFSATDFNGAPCLTFDGADDSLAMGSSPFPSGADPFEVWVVAQQNTPASDTANRRLLSFGGATSVTRFEIYRQVSGGVNRVTCTAGNGTIAPPCRNDTTVFSSRHLIRAQVTGTQVISTVDNDAPVAVSVVPALGSASLAIGSPNNFGGLLRDILVTKALSAGQAASLQSILMSRRML